MSHCHHHDHHHGHSHHHHNTGDVKLSWAIVINLVLTASQIVAGVISGSLALVADALHNLSDAAAMVLALVARKISRKQADKKRTYGYKKVETLAAFINFLSLIFIALWLAYEAIVRFFNPQIVDGWLVVWVAALATIINGTTAYLVYYESKNNQNMRAAFLHNFTDMISSVGVVIAGTLMIVYGWYWIDPLITLVISAYVLVHATHDLPKICDVLIDAAPSDINLDNLKSDVLSVAGVQDMHHVHLRYLNESSYALEAHIVLDATDSNMTVDSMSIIKSRIKTVLEGHKIMHSTLEFENVACDAVECR